MVRILGLFCLCLGLAAQAEAKVNCEAELTSLHLSGSRTLGYLKKVGAEIDRDYPNQNHIRLGVGRGVGPLVAALAASGSPVYSVPVEFNLKEPLATDAKARLWKLFQLYLPNTAAAGKNIVLLVYSDDASSPSALEHLIREYYAQVSVEIASVQVVVFSSQAHVRHLQEDLGKALSAGEFKLRPMAPNNDVQQWLRDGSEAGPYDYSQFKNIDVLDAKSEAQLGAVEVERQHFIQLVELLRGAP